jgi:glycerophosphoryl diester phosphodiesterase
MSTSHHPWCIAHRGARNEAPDNTSSAFMRALNYPIDGIELDVQMSADGVPVLYHDSTLLRVGGGRRRVADLTITQLQSLNWGGWFHADFALEPLMLLEQLLPWLNRCPRLLIEIKSHPSEQTDGHAYRLTEKVIAMIDQPRYRKYRDRILILCFDPQVLALAHGLAPHLRMVLNLVGNEPDPDQYDTAGLWAIDLGISHLTPTWVQWARNRGLKVMSYTCNGPRQVSKAMRLGIDGLISDRPGWLTQLLGRVA